MCNPGQGEACLAPTASHYLINPSIFIGYPINGHPPVGRSLQPYFQRKSHLLTCGLIVAATQYSRASGVIIVTTVGGAVHRACRANSWDVALGREGRGGVGELLLHWP